MSVLFDLPKESAAVRIFCFPFAGGTAAAYRGWVKKLPKWVDVCPVELPGHGTRYKEALINDIGLLKEKLFQELRNYLDRPYILFGHSMGALIALELAHHIKQNHLSNKDERLLSVIMSGRPAPSHALIATNHHLLDDKHFLQWLTRFGGIPEELELYPEVMKLAIPILRNDVMLIENMKKQQIAFDKLSISLMAVSGTEEPDFTFEGLNAWQNYTHHWLGAYQISGGHFYFQIPQSLNSLCQLIRIHCNDVCPDYRE